jgi:hypothetical protein
VTSLLLAILCLLSSYDLTIARLKYDGGGDWYNDPDIIPNLAQELNTRTTLKVNPQQATISLDDENLFDYPFIFMTGHGNIDFSDYEVKKLREYLIKGGFLYVDDDYGMDKYFKREIKKVFPGLELEELPFSHPIYHCFYDFPHGIPKIHKHDGKPPKGYGIFYEGRLVVFYAYETNISDGWTDTHDDPPEKREEAFKMGINIIIYAMTSLP